jgi:hypothetical protein
MIDLGVFDSGAAVHVPEAFPTINGLNLKMG